MDAKDSYTSYLIKIVSELERIYEVPVSGLENDIKSVIKVMDQNAVSAPSSVISEKNTEAGKQIVLLAYITARMSYFESVRLDFSMFPAMQEVADILNLYRDRKNFNRCARRMNEILKVLADADMHSAKARQGLGYRFLRMFVILVMYRNSCNASIVATMLLEQMILKVG